MTVQSLWYVIRHFPNLEHIASFKSQSAAVEFYENNCVDRKNNNCWGAIVKRPKGFFDIEHG